MFHRIGRWTTRFWPLVIASWALLAVALVMVAPDWHSVAQDGHISYLPGEMTSVRGNQLLVRAFPGASPQLDPDDITDLPALAGRLAEAAQAAPPSPGKHLWNLFPPEVQQLLTRAGQGHGLVVREREQVLEALNGILAEDDFSQQKAFAGVSLGPDDQQFLQNREKANAVSQGSGGVSVQPQVAQQGLPTSNRLWLEAAFPGLIDPLPRGQANSRLVLVMERPDSPLTAADLEALERLAAGLTPQARRSETIERPTPEQQAHPGLPVVSVMTPQTPVIGRKLLSEDGRAALAVLGLRTEFMEVANQHVLEALLQRIDLAREQEDWPPGLQVGVTGSAAVGGDIIKASAESIANTETTTIALVLIILLLVYRAPLLVVIPLATIGTSVVVAVRLMAILADQPWAWLDFQVFTTSKIFIVVILFGAGTDFCLFLISRYQEFLGQGVSRRQALEQAQGQVGPAVAASAITTVLGLGVMWFADFGKYHYTGPTIGLCLAVALLACLTLAPALLQMAGLVVFWPFGRRYRLAAQTRIQQEPVQPAASAPGNLGTVAGNTVDGGNVPPTSGGGWLWNRLAGAVLARPGLVLVLSLAVLTPGAMWGWHRTVSFDLLSDLPSHRPSVEGTRMLERHFAPGDIGPVTVIAYQPRGFSDAGSTQQVAGDPQVSPVGAELKRRQEENQRQEATRQLTERLYQLPQVADVRSLTNPLGGEPVRPSLSRLWTRPSALTLPRHHRTKSYYITPVEGLDGRYTRLEVVLKTGPFSPESLEAIAVLDQTLGQISADPQGPWYQAEFDLCGVSAGLRDLRAVSTSDLRKIQPLVVVVVFATLLWLVRNAVVSAYLMATVLLTYYLTLGVTQMVFSTLYAETFLGLDWKLPLFVFVILVAVGMDYNIYLITRIREERQRRGAILGLREALIRTGGIITSCGLIMAGTFLSMTTGSLRGLVELGFALCFGILVDTFFIRTLLVPSFIALISRQRSPESKDSSGPTNSSQSAVAASL